MAGKFIEDSVPGQVDISPGRSVTETDVIAFPWVSSYSPIGQRTSPNQADDNRGT